MNTPVEYRYIIDAFTPETLPMARLAEYMQEVAALLGERERVHFARLEHGSAVLVSKIEPVASPRVWQRVHGLLDGTAGEDVRQALRKLDAMLAEDNAVGELNGGYGQVIAFPGRNRPQQQTYGPVNQDSTLDGRLVRVGGRGPQYRALLDDGHRVYPCLVSKEQAKRMAQHLFEPVRVTGRGRWSRDTGGEWKLHAMRVYSFELLDDRPLSAVVAELRKVGGNGWREVDDPYGELRRLRHGDDE